ncbi:hypothetical protein ElyMa_000909100 [Elysia marginata]|uniref:Uncharacterized protein n=1 Tax=Elysia marginata TaxID=1093978 RepID=A0AAV4HAH6_9GAST|nr:hypothetical protein ElyMa_000909100 [Elysia marginata]
MSRYEPRHWELGGGIKANKDGRDRVSEPHIGPDCRDDSYTHTQKPQKNMTPRHDQNKGLNESEHDRVGLLGECFLRSR